MRAQSWTDIMSLLAVMVMTNKYEPARERDVFTQGALTLRDMVAPNMRLSEELAGDWLEQNRPTLLKQTSSVYYEETVSRLLKNLRGLTNKQAILTALMKITLSDTGSAEITKVERKNTRVIENATERWDLEHPLAA